MRGFASKILCQEAEKVTATSQTSGVNVTNAKRARPLLMMIVVATQSATVASNWLAMPNSGQSELIPPSGSCTPSHKKNPHAAPRGPPLPQKESPRCDRQATCNKDAGIGACLSERGREMP